ncbi:EAL domain-containing protein [Azovibrio restrictus]|uniref:EAL domain-containing protein n=1 Tax=Azovibrio restrictus TaxID=146938 RepID=UPI0026EC3B8B|nr:EAL domain-containing protein [Azovibrio restrictus]MDD3482483.1 EAL domain-containing protein [Azovibrio restrictus]
MKLPATLRPLVPWLLLAVLAGVLISLYALSTRIADNDRVQVELNVRQAMTLDTRINLDVLRLRHRQLLDYDSLSLSANQVDELLARLQVDFERLGLSEALHPAREEWGRKQQALDDFRRQNAVLVNSLYHFVNLTTQLHSDWDAGARVPVALLNSVTRDVLIFVNEQQTKDIFLTLAGLNRLEVESRSWPEPAATQGRLLAAHGKVIVNNHLPVQNLMHTISRSTFPQDMEQAYAEYSRVYARAAAEAEHYRRLMAIFALFMIAAVVLIMLRLRHTARELTRSHSLLDNVADHLGEGILSFDGRGMLNFVNRRAETLLGRSEGELLGQGVAAILPEVGAQDSSFRAALAAGRPFEGEEWLQRPDGELLPVAFLGGPLPRLDNSGGPAGYVTSFRDVSAQRQAEARLRLAARVFDNLSEAMTITGPDGLIQSVNPAFTAITGYTEAEARGHTPGSLLGSGLHDREFYQGMWGALQAEGKWQGEIINRRKGGETYPEWLSITAVRDEAGQVLQYIALFSDISERKQAEAYIHHLAYHDPLTGLANRLLFHDRLDNAMHQAHRTRRPMAIMLLDLDRFKSINDSLGHAAGDVLLKSVSQRLSHLLREGDTLARLGGDEFALLLPEISSHADAASLASRMLGEFDTPFDLDGREVFTSTSIGIAVYPSDGESPEILLKNADVALYNAKDAGRSAFRFFLESDSENSLERLELETAMRHAVARDELRLYYQPQVDTRNGLILGVEALVRWQHPTRGLLLPDDFIPLAETTGYIDILGRWCLQTACRQLVAWQLAGLPIQRVAVNVSARQLRNPAFTEMVFDILKETGIHPRCLELELTESSLADDPDRTFSIFAQLRRKGIRIAIDDFGTGYSSLSYLSRFPVDVVKIDKSFVQGLGSESESRSVVQAVILLAHALSMETVAEGVETEIQRKRLAELDCDQLQGFLFARPCLPAQLIDLPCVADEDLD